MQKPFSLPWAIMSGSSWHSFSWGVVRWFSISCQMHWAMRIHPYQLWIAMSGMPTHFGKGSRNAHWDFLVTERGMNQELGHHLTCFLPPCPLSHRQEDVDHKLRLPIPTEVIYWDDIRWSYLHLTNHRRSSCGTKPPEALGFAGLCVAAMVTMRYSAGDKNVMLTLSACCFEGASVWPLWSLIMPYSCHC
jgi:hypothetical protein